jgi:negative regulator of flagellin synthesis FlgM
MVSHISSSPGSPRAAAESDRLRGTPRPAAATTVGPVTEDSVQLSVGPGILPAALTGGPPVDTALVARIGTAIAAGRYPVDPDRIAEALFRDYADLNG